MFKSKLFKFIWTLTLFSNFEEASLNYHIQTLKSKTFNFQTFKFSWT